METTETKDLWDKLILLWDKREKLFKSKRSRLPDGTPTEGAKDRMMKMGKQINNIHGKLNEM